MRKWVATTALITAHVQVAITLGYLVVWRGSAVARALDAVSSLFANAAAVHPQCLLPQQPPPLSVVVVVDARLLMLEGRWPDPGRAGT